MKKRLFCCLLALALALGLGACYDGGPLSGVSGVLGVNLSNGAVLQNVDTHSGFRNDGLYALTLEFGGAYGADAAIQIAANDQWRPLPMTDPLREAAETLLLGEDGERYIPEVETGYYFFLDRHSQATTPDDDSDLFSRSSFNFTLAVYDTQTNRLYYCVLDT